MRTWRNILMTCMGIALLAVTGTAQTSPFTGDWMGTLNVQSMSLRIVFHITAGEKAGWQATMDSPDQGANGIPVDSVVIDDRSVRLVLPRVQGEYRGTIGAGDSTIEGTWTQAGRGFALRLRRTSGGVSFNRPQEPRPPFPYRTEEVTFRNTRDDVTLAGTFTTPDGDGPFPGVALISGSGPQDRDETVFNHKPFMVIADHLTRSGIAVLRYDDRGTGSSTGSFAGATSEDFSRDAEAAVQFLRSRDDIDGSRIGLIGHSEGAMIAPMVAVRSQGIAFIVLLAGPSIPGDRLILLQDSLISSVNLATPEEITASMRLNKSLFRLLETETDTALLRQKMERLLTDAAMANTDASVSEELIRRSVAQTIRQLTSPWFRFFLSYDPAPILRKVTCPVLALNGEKDLQVPARINLDGIRNALAQGGNTASTVRELPGLNHLFQTAGTGSPREYSSIEETFSPEALDILRDWILQTVSLN